MESDAIDAVTHGVVDVALLSIFAVERRGGRGRCAVTHRQLAAGAVVVFEDPWAAVLMKEEVGQRCDFSFSRPEKFVHCSTTGLSFESQAQRKAARELFYDSEFRAASSWAASSEPSRKDRPALSSTMRLAVRALWRSARERQVSWSFLDDHWEDLDSVREAQLEAQARVCLEEFKHGFCNDAMGRDDVSSKVGVGTIVRLLAAIDINTMVVTDEEERGIALGLYLQGAIFNHDEEPNCVQSFRGRRLLIRTIRPVAAGEELTIAYSELAEVSSLRRARLRAQYFFDPLPKGLLPSSVAERDRVLCEVLGCDSEGRWCRLAQGIVWSSEAGIHCSRGGKHVSGADVDHVDCDDHGPASRESAAASLAQHVHNEWAGGRAATNSGDVRGAARRYRNAWDGMCSEGLRLGEGHSLRLAVARDGMDAAIDAERWGDAATFARAVCSSNRLLYPPGWPVTALSLARLAKLELYHGRVSAAMQAGEESLRTLALSSHDESDVIIELRQIVAQARAEAQARSPGCNVLDLQGLD